MTKPKTRRARYVTVAGDGPIAKRAAREHYFLSWGRRPFAVVRYDGGWLACNLACFWWLHTRQGRTPTSPGPDER